MDLLTKSKAKIAFFSSVGDCNSNPNVNSKNNIEEKACRRVINDQNVSVFGQWICKARRHSGHQKYLRSFDTKYNLLAPSLLASIFHQNPTASPIGSPNAFHFAYPKFRFVVSS